MTLKSYLIGAAACGIAGWIGTSQTHAAFVGLSGAGDEDASDKITVAAHSGEAANREIIHSINGTGMNPGGVNPNMDAGGNPTGNMSLFRGNSGQHGGTVTGSHWAKYEFDQNYAISNIWIWNWNETSFPAFGWKNVTIQTSLTGGTTAGEWTTVFTGQIPISDGANPSAVDLVAPVSGGSITARYVMLTNTGTISTGDDGVEANHENWSSDGQHGTVFTNDAGLSEVRFELVPEPAMLSLLSFGFLALARNRRS